MDQTRFISNAAIVITNSIKIAGLYVGIRTATQPHPSAIVLAFSGFLITGGQISETMVLGFLERFFAVDRTALEDKQGTKLKQPGPGPGPGPAPDTGDDT